MEVRKKNAKNLLLYPIEKFFQMYLTSSETKRRRADDRTEYRTEQMANNQPHDGDDDEQLIVVYSIINENR